MELNIQEMIFQFLGGLGIFLFGIKYMGDGLQKSAGDRLRDILDRFTTNPFMGVLTGIIVTCLIQSSSGTTVLTVGLVSAGFLNLRQAIGIIMGANIGTTITAFIIGIKVSDYALPIIAVGAVLLFFFKSRKVHNFGQIVFGFGALFFGLELMGDGMKPLQSLQEFRDFTLMMSDNSILGVFVGTIFTVIVQSSSATIGILQELHAQGLMDIQAALPVLFGDNIGTTITAVLASIGASVAARRAAATHVLFNLIGATIFIIILPFFTDIVVALQGALDLNPKMTIAFAHGIFNVTNTVIQFPFIAGLAYIVTKLIPGDDSIIEYKTQHLDPIFIEQSPAIAVGQAQEEVIRMGKFAIKGLEETRDFLNTKQPKHAETAYQLEDAINNLDQKITDYLVKLSSRSLSKNESSRHAILVDTVRDIERIGDHFENIVELTEVQANSKTFFSDSALEDLQSMFSVTLETVRKAIDALDFNEKDLAVEVLKKERIIDDMEKSLRKKHIARMNDGKCSVKSGVVFVDIASNLERIGDHAVNIAETVLGDSKYKYR
ncbi:Na/Pi cotransporter family protein [Bacillus sp. AGMB 02131]|uniref:Na/Pi cotransporter family protein n=1 Tax=Peribacillus faecalis TaxID=2772559 RepID=A0A927CYG2_9BACI|nr:Na/Pi cotransporter family protein [Peribacillus faecalis]MBD3107639.1 Na/Pi cotransporter family protein [Peribacillus faecalis]